jgi:tryptophanyl-tRNA synthetase
MKQKIFSGIQPSGNLHLGNYLGAIKNWVELQDEYASIFCIVDLHAITAPQEPAKLKAKTLEIAKVYLAAGIDPEKSTIFIQSHIAQHTELMWILNTIAKTGELFKMTQFKDKSAKAASKETIDLGLLNYPVLMAADILLYDAQLVPVGEDQLQHIELARDLAKRFNHRFGETFVIPKGFVKEEGMRIMGLDDPAKKMSKSASSEYNYISLIDDETAIRKKIKKAVTDSGSEIIYSDDKPALKNLLNIYALLSNKSVNEIVREYTGQGYGQFKDGLTEELLAFLKPFQEKISGLSDEETLQTLKSGAEKLLPIAMEKMKEVKEKIGFIL